MSLTVDKLISGLERMVRERPESGEKEVTIRYKDIKDLEIRWISNTGNFTEIVIGNPSDENTL